MRYEKPSVVRFGSFREVTRSGSPNQSLDFGSFTDFLGPSEPTAS